MVRDLVRKLVRRPMFEPGLVTVAAFLTVVRHAIEHPGAMDNYTLLADAWINHRAWIEYPGDWIDAVPFHGRAYIIEAPLPAVLMYPYASFAHVYANESLVSAMVFAIGCGAIVWLARDFGFPLLQRLIFVVFFAFGTSFFFSAWHGDVWYFAHICTVTFTLLTLILLVNNGRAEFIIFFAICAGLSRFTFLPIVGLYVVYLYATRGRRAWGRITSEALWIIVPVGALMIWYNFARWGVPYDLGYTYFYHMMIDRHGSPFGLRYFPNDMWMMFAVPPAFFAAPPFVLPIQVGPGLLWTAWPMGVAAYARQPQPLVILLWAATLVALIPNLVYFSFGDVSFGARHALDFTPFLLVLMMLALRPRSPRWMSAAMLFGGALGGWLLAHYEGTYM